MRWSPLFSKSAALGLILAKHYCLKAIPILMADRIVENWGYRVVTKLHSIKFRFVFITGCTSFKDSPIFDAVNNVRDVSEDPKFKDIVDF